MLVRYPFKYPARLLSGIYPEGCEKNYLITGNTFSAAARMSPGSLVCVGFSLGVLLVLLAGNSLYSSIRIDNHLQQLLLRKPLQAARPTLRLEPSQLTQRLEPRSVWSSSAPNSRSATRGCRTPTTKCSKCARDSHSESRSRCHPTRRQPASSGTWRCLPPPLCSRTRSVHRRTPRVGCGAARTRAQSAAPHARRSVIAK